MRHDPDAIMLFAAGFGTRMGALTADRPKPLIEVAGQTLLDHALALTEGISTRIVNAHYRAAQIEAHLSGREIPVLTEAPHILDTGGGLRAALPRLGRGPVFTLNTDAIWTGPNPLATLSAGWRAQTMEALLLLVPAERAQGYTGIGDFSIGADGRIMRGPGYVYTGAQILKPDGLHQIRERAFSLNKLWDKMAARGTLFGVVHRGGWCDVGHPEGIARAEAMLANPPALLA